MKKKTSTKGKTGNRIKSVVKSSKKLRAIETGNLISDLTDAKVTSIAFGGDIPEIGFNAQEFNHHYKKYENQELKQFYKDKCNEARKANGLPPI